MERMTFDEEKVLEDIKHDHILIQIEEQKKARLSVEITKFENTMSVHRIKRADSRRAD